MKTKMNYLTVLFLLLMLSSCNILSNLFNSPWNGKLPDNALCLKDAQTLEENYINKEGDITDNRVFSFTYDQIADYMSYLRYQGNKLGIDEKDLGLRIYLGAKLENEFTDDYIKNSNNKGKSEKRDGELRLCTPITEEKTFYNTVFLTATQKSETSDDPGDYINIYKIAPMNYGSSRRPPKDYILNSDLPSCQMLTNSTNHIH